MYCLLVLVYRRVDTAAHFPLTVVHVVVGKDAGGGDGRVSQNATWQGWQWGIRCESMLDEGIMCRKGPILSRP